MASRSAAIGGTAGKAMRSVDGLGIFLSSKGDLLDDCESRSDVIAAEPSIACTGPDMDIVLAISVPSCEVAPLCRRSLEFRGEPPVLVAGLRVLSCVLPERAACRMTITILVAIIE